MAILLVTQDAEVTSRCRRAVSAEHQLEVVDTVAQLNAKIRALAPSVVILDSAVLAAPFEREAGMIVGSVGDASVIVMTPAFHEEEEIALLKVGVKGCCRRGIDPESLQQVLNVTSNGGVWVTRTLVPRLVSELRRYAQVSRPALQRKPEDKLKLLTRREKDIVMLIVSGASNKEVGEALNISDRTVKGHLSNIFQKLDVPDRLKLMLYVNEADPKAAASEKRP
jgi:two-component system nitrate/nitrite response regulator NarL